ncbi:Ni/Fe hydrogenase subunit alpha [Mycolicibacterium palauense]|uniref:Ni/Fe hydrogenase subunit alpha n=1 Tax=Mycolicibacterium palauense TaxID=2034511 RepID=UPI000BFEC53F|nr:Ni/Fe hydrogenase subunit alpha [Mycolicibacterium palauense]
MTTTTRNLSLDLMTRVEGEGAFDVTFDGDRVARAELRIFEPPRFFEAFLRGRSALETPDITARICGICPVAYQTSACNAVEDALGVRLDPMIAALRRLLYCGEWISSHALHIYLLHAPDFLGYPDAMTMAADHREAVERGLALKKTGNQLLELLGGRAVHPVNVRVGGFYSLPSDADLQVMAGRLRTALEAAVQTVHWVAGFEFPELEVDHDLLAAHTPEQYAIETGTVTTSTGLRFEAAQFAEHVVESQAPYSTALQARLDGRRYLTGPLARYSLNSAQLSPLAAEAARSAGLGAQCRNPFRAIVVRAVEVVYAIEEALRIIDDYRRPARPFSAVTPGPGTGHGVSEAPRGLLYHRYALDAEGMVTAANIVAPTSQNQGAMEHDLTTVATANNGLDDAALTTLCERTIRCYDPCISCAAHFLTVRVRRR